MPRALATLLFAALLLLTLVQCAKVTNPNKVPKNAVLLSKVNSLTVRAGKQTASRRVSPVPQLQCVGPANVCKLFTVDVMRCTNEGSDYDAESVQWACKASLPDEFKLGSTDVTCEGYESSDDPYVLKGSCGVEYRLLLTDKGGEKYGRKSDPWFDEGEPGQGSTLFKYIFLLTFAAVAFIILSSLFLQWQQRDQQGPRRPPTTWGGFGGGDNDDDDPPPPYDPYPRNYGSSKKSAPRSSTSTRPSSSQPQQQPWRPGFWTGAATGAAAGYFAGGRNNTRTQPAATQRNGGGLFGGGGRTGVNMSPRTSSSSSSPSYSGSRHESTGFGSTSRR
ncbi:uncharacterized protein HMPREF1541_09438 [Cyphellophora europaea CBS 101466]|uniref:Store-operated calcium entry-associated regulatory factor n=1 Tax=Cyphellophora europaea (strain CBS 101466) TaxID=1220924 RepID=W2SA45_CYPE1|nr:uncharacterized protein HMPREF1541_09438 [Cyphellophora europaea CBS 101466]ETN45606.1 hypothetical protein HMPREF1541_09438 [Cyphellophora europaea CBS 101466]